MIPLKKDYRDEVSLKISINDDFWYLTHIIEKGDVVRSKTERKIKIGTPDGNMRVTRKTIVLTIKVESVNLSNEGDILRIKGTVVKGPEDVPVGSYHTFGLGVGDSFSIHKQSWPDYIKNLLEEAIKNSANTFLFALFDREKAIFSLVKQTGIQHLRELHFNVQKKQYSSSNTEESFSSIVKQLEEDNASFKPQTIICASPSFWKRYVEEQIPPDLKKKTLFIETGTIHKGEVFKLLTRPELQQLLESHQLRREEDFTNNFLKKLDKNLVVYGLKDVSDATNQGAVGVVAITDGFIKKTKEEETYEEVDSLLKTIDSMKGKIHFLHSEQTSKIIDGFGGIVGILRWEL